MEYNAAKNRYKQTVYRRVGQSGLHLPPVSLGLWQNFGSVNNFDNARQILLRAFDLGVTHFDLANNYGPEPGTAELTLGRILSSDLRPYRDELIISTKAGYTMWPGPYGDFGSRKYMLASLDQSLMRMKLGYVDIFYSHRFDPDTPLEETMGALATAVQSGKALYAGISNYNSEQTLRAVKILQGYGVRCLINQPRYNMFDRRAENDGLFNMLERLGLGSIVYSPLAQGMLTSRYLKGIPQSSRAARQSLLSKNELTSERMATIKNLTGIAAERDQTLAQMALAWVLRDGFASSALIGASSVSQLEENLSAVNNLKFTADEISTIEKALS